VFLALLDRPAVDRLASELEHIIDTRCDDVRLYHLPSRVEWRQMGRPWLPRGTALYQKGLPVEPLSNL